MFYTTSTISISLKHSINTLILSYLVSWFNKACFMNKCYLDSNLIRKLICKIKLYKNNKYI